MDTSTIHGIHNRFASEQDLEFVLNGRWEVYKAEKHSLDSFDPKEERANTLKAITNQNIIIIEKDKGL